MTESRLALVTGAAQGLGRAIAERLARDGCSLLMADESADEAKRAAEAMRAAGREAFPLALDVGDEAAVARAYAEIESRHGRLDILVNNAGACGESARVESMSLEDWEKVIRTNLTGAFLMSRGAIPLMRRGRWGRIVNMSSLSARGQPGVACSGYVACDAGIISLSRVLAEDLGRDGINVNCVAPSPTQTATTESVSVGNQQHGEPVAASSALGRLVEPDEIADGVAWLCSERASFFTGIVLDINGGTVMR